ncbi:MAG TPA: hypothetical protein VFV33_19635, partial [Gemmatimonadaceae bacterium]|nr:hypothetical protein [Gemmatimonadaceae bacterium]
WLMDKRALAFEPDVIWFVSYNDESLDLRTHLAKMVRLKSEIPYEYLRDIIRRANVTPDLTEAEATTRLQPYHAEMMEWTYRQVLERCRARGIHPVWIYLPATRIPRAEEPRARAVALAQRAGFASVVDTLATVYDNHRLEDIVVAAYDFHPNAKMHGIIADWLYEQLRTHPELVTGPGPGR